VMQHRRERKSWQGLFLNVQICAYLPYRAVAQDGYSLEHSHHQDMSKLDYHQFPTNLNSAAPVVISKFLCLSSQPHTRISHQSSF